MSQPTSGYTRESTVADSFRPEAHGIDYISDEERHGRPFSLFTLWFGAQAVLLIAGSGAAAAFPGMSFTWYVIAIVTGTILGSLLACGHAAQGPTIGIPQMIQTRAQFGFLGGALPMAIILFAWFIFLPPSAALFGQILQSLVPAINVHWGVVIFTILAFAVAMWGYDLCHRYAQIAAAASVITLGAMTGVIIANHPFGTGVHINAGPFQSGIFFGAFGLAFILAAAYSGGVADYSRYLPRTTGNLQAGIWTGLGIAVPTIWLCCLGIGITLASKGNPDLVGLFTTAGNTVGGWFTTFFFAAALFALIAQGFIIIYVGGNTAMALISSLTLRSRAPKPSAAIRACYVVPVAVVGLLLGEVATGGVGTFLNDCLSVLLVLIVPWSAINLADFYLVRRGHYSIEDMFTPHGRYGLVSARGYAAYFITLVCEIPFLHVLSFEGPVASALGGGDISFVVGIVLGVSLYWALMRTKVSRETITPEEATSKVELA